MECELAPLLAFRHWIPRRGEGPAMQRTLAQLRSRRTCPVPDPCPFTAPKRPPTTPAPRAGRRKSPPYCLRVPPQSCVHHNINQPPSTLETPSRTFCPTSESARELQSQARPKPAKPRQCSANALLAPTGGVCSRRAKGTFSSRHLSRALVPPVLSCLFRGANQRKCQAGSKNKTRTQLDARNVPRVLVRKCDVRQGDAQLICC